METKDVKVAIDNGVAEEALAKLKEICGARVAEASKRINAICEELGAALLAQIVIEGNQINSQIVIVSKTQ